MTHLYIGCAASIYPTPPIWYIDVKSQRNRTCLKLHCLLWIRTSNVIILNITCSGSQHYLFSDFIQYIKCSFSSFSLQFPPIPCSSVVRVSAMASLLIFRLSRLITLSNSHFLTIWSYSSFLNHLSGSNSLSISGCIPGSGNLASLSSISLKYSIVLILFSLQDHASE